MTTVIRSAQNEKLKQWKKLTQRKEREKRQQYILEGFHLVEEMLLHAKDEIVTLLVSEEIRIPSKWNVDGVEITYLSAIAAESLAETEHSQAVFAVCEMPKQNKYQTAWKKILLLDSVQDPGNVGTLIRTADAAGFDAIVLGKGSADLYNGKVLRSAQGSHVHLPIIREDLEALLDDLQENDVPTFGTSLQNATSVFSVTPPEKFALIVGNEGQGVKTEILEKTTANVYIPLAGKAESLNVGVAAGVLMFHFTK
ncbi:TrmH family RNA methyltransferase [Mangrovibacillus cuniculi]|uniref:RNA methyltransferase n=1 Tax=Mangrovibacillus cuniculi TaxID=2593652 RepID=A0A7S8CC03_9BACI|nr:RNA methyltransferase [Mangrovibacillus cuniculi]QPC47175.1 RNA methyltransferase [Mangrovibacillus cuniculi]